MHTSAGLLQAGWPDAAHQSGAGSGVIPQWAGIYPQAAHGHVPAMKQAPFNNSNPIQNSDHFRIVFTHFWRSMPRTIPSGSMLGCERLLANWYLNSMLVAQDPMVDALIRAVQEAPLESAQQQRQQPEHGEGPGAWSCAPSPATGTANLLTALNLSSAAALSPLQLPVDMQLDTQV